MAKNLAEKQIFQAISWNREYNGNSICHMPLGGEGFFERLVGIKKRSLSKVVGRSTFSFEAFEEVLLDFECAMNNRPWCYL